MTEETHTDSSEPRKGKSNAILTYELLSAFDQKLTRLVAQFEGLKESLEERREGFQDHERRLRSLEATQTATNAASNTSRGTLRDAWVAAGVVLSLLMSLANLLHTLLGNQAH